MNAHITRIKLYDEQNEVVKSLLIDKPYKVKKGSIIKIELSADNYYPEIISHFIVSNNTNIIRKLRSYPAYVNFIAINTYGNEVTGFTVFARESTDNNQGEWISKGDSGSPIPLPSEKKWEFYLAKRRDDDSLRTKTVEYLLKAGGEVNKSLVYQIVN